MTSEVRTSPNNPKNARKPRQRTLILDEWERMRQVEALEHDTLASLAVAPWQAGTTYTAPTGEAA